MLLPTFYEVKNSRLREVSASCNSSDDFRSLVNEATDLLMQRGDWPGTLVPMRFQVRGGCIVWPRGVQQVRRINQCKVPIKKETIWGDYIDKQDYVGWCGANLYAWGGNFGVAYRGLAQGYNQSKMISQGRVPTFNDVPSDTPRYLRCYCLTQKDIGKKVTVFGMDGNNQPLTTQNSDGTLSDGIILTLAIPFISSSVYVSRVDAVLKEYTNGRVPMYSYDPISNTQLQLAMYEPNEVNPSYAKDRLDVALWPNRNTCEFTVLALVKLAFVPVFFDTDYVLIPSMSALKCAMQAVKFGEAGDANSYSVFLQKAVDSLNAVLENEQPLDQTSVDSGFGGGIQVGMQQVI